MKNYYFFPGTLFCLLADQNKLCREGRVRMRASGGTARGTARALASCGVEVLPGQWKQPAHGGLGAWSEERPRETRLQTLPVSRPYLFLYFRDFVQNFIQKKTLFFQTLLRKNKGT